MPGSRLFIIALQFKKKSNECAPKSLKLASKEGLRTVLSYDFRESSV